MYVKQLSEATSWLHDVPGTWRKTCVASSCWQPSQRKSPRLPTPCWRYNQLAIMPAIWLWIYIISCVLFSWVANDRETCPSRLWRVFLPLSALTRHNVHLIGGWTVANRRASVPIYSNRMVWKTISHRHQYAGVQLRCAVGTLLIFNLLLPFREILDTL